MHILGICVFLINFLDHLLICATEDHLELAYLSSKTKTVYNNVPTNFAVQLWVMSPDREATKEKTGDRNGILEKGGKYKNHGQNKKWHNTKNFEDWMCQKVYWKVTNVMVVIFAKIKETEDEL